MTTPKLVYAFSEGNKDQKDLLGGKGANLAEMTKLGLPVPPGFTITTEACREYLRTGTEPAGPAEPDQLRGATSSRSRWAARWVTRPTRCCFRCARGAKFSMPGMMETVLNIGLNDESVNGLAEVVRQRRGSRGTPTAG
ncbi:MAG: PEP/pyruvate-binding domain-containing protein [Candidatus Nanopelagicales bacterium]